MPNLTIYVPRELADEVRRHGVKVSATCQAALARKVRLEQRRAAPAAAPLIRDVWQRTSGAAEPPEAS